MSVEAVLFDADGVIQQQSEAWRLVLADVLGRSDAPVEEFFHEVFAAERPALAGQADLRDALSEVLARWQCRGTLEDALGAWTLIHVDEGMLDIVRALRQAGMRCCLASNQVAHRARHMSEALGYAGLFDREFYSCHLRVAKPDEGFFRAILADLALPAGRVLFLDDHEPNVEAARRVGIRASVFPRNAGAEKLRSLLHEAGVSVGLAGR